MYLGPVLHYLLLYMILSNLYYLSITHNFTVVDHMPKLIDKYRKCKTCSTKAKEKRSNMICSKREITLCKQCFEPYHKPT
jgi:hypothetical protein